MHITPIIKTLTAGIVLSTTTMCKKVSYTELPEKYVSPILREQLDSVAFSSREILKNSSYHIFKKDTVQITQDFIANPNKFIEYLNHRSDSLCPKTSVRARVYQESLFGSKLKVSFPLTVVEYEPNFTDCKAVIRSTKIFTKNSKDMFVPVEYCGKPNLIPSKK